MVTKEALKKAILAKKALLFDVEGVLCDNIDDGRVLARVPEFMQEVRKRGIKIAVVTNISRKPKNVVLSRLLKMGLTVEEDELFTSGATAARYIKSKFLGGRCFAISEWGLREDLEREGVELADEGKVEVVAVGADRRLTYAEMNHAMRQAMGGAELVCAGTGMKFAGNFLGDSGFFLGEGAIAQAIGAAAGREVTYIGKPHLKIFQHVLRTIGVSQRDSLMIGDNLSSDIMGANHYGIDSLYITKGSSMNLKRVELEQTPTYSSSSVDDLYSILFAS